MLDLFCFFHQNPTLYGKQDHHLGDKEPINFVRESLSSKDKEKIDYIAIQNL